MPQRDGAAVPRELLRFVYADWADEEADGPPPPHWQGGSGAVGMWHDIRAHKRYSAAVRAWRAEHDVSYDDWQALRAEHGIGVAVDR